MAKRSPNPAARLVSRSELASLLNLSPNRISELRVAGVIDSVVRSEQRKDGSWSPHQFDVLECTRRYLQYRQAKSTQRFQSGDRDELESKARKYRSILQKDRNKLETLQEETHPIPELSDCYQYFRCVILDELEKLPERIADLVVTASDISDTSDAVEQSTYAALNNIRERLQNIKVDDLRAV